MGLTAGLALAFGISRPLAPLLSEGTVSDGRLCAGVALATALAGLAALWLPARRAVRVDPVVALRSE